MKRLFLLFALLPMLAMAQDYSEVVQVSNKQASELYSSAREWFAKNFKSANHVLQMDDPELGKLIGKGVIPINYNYMTGGGIASIPVVFTFNADFTMTVQVKDGRYKYEINDILILHGPEKQPYSEYKKNYEFYKIGMTDEGAKQQIELYGAKASKMTIRITKLENQHVVMAIDELEAEILATIDSFKNSMVDTSEDDW